MGIAQQEIEEANALAREGNSQAAIALLSRLIQQDSSNVDAWLALADVVDEPERVEFCLQKVLALDPGNEAALERLSKDEGGSLSVGSVASTPASDAPSQDEQVAVDPGAVEAIEHSPEPESRPQPEAIDVDQHARSEDPVQPESDLEIAIEDKPEQPVSGTPAQPPSQPMQPQADVAQAEPVQAQPTEKRSRMGRTDLILIGLTVLAGIVLCALVSVALLT